MSAIDDGGTAFPWDYNQCGHGGMTLRDYFAGEATHDDLALPQTVADYEKLLGLNPGEYKYMIHYPQAVAKARYVFADAMLRARKVPA